MALGRPGRASPAFGMATFLKPNMVVLLQSFPRNIGLALLPRNGPNDHVWASPRYAAFTRMGGGLRPRVADQGFFLAPEHKAQNAKQAEQAPARCRQNTDHQRIPKVAAGVRPDYRLKAGKAAGIEQFP